MVVTSLYAPQNADAAAKNAVVVAGSKKVVKSKNLYVGGKTVDFDAYIKGKNVKNGTWKSSNSKVASVDKNGVVKALKNGKVTISFKTKATKKTKSQTVKVVINARTRASKMMLTPASVMVKEGEKTEVMASFELSKKVMAAGGKTTTYKLFADSSDEKVAKVTTEGTKIVVEGVAKSATPVSITVYAAQVDSLEKAKEVKIKLTQKFDVKVNSKLDAKQSGANKITVMGSDLVASKSAFVVKNSSGVVLPIKDVKVNEAKTEAVLEGETTQIPVGKYTLSYNNSDPVEFEVVKAVVKSIEITPTGKAIMAKPVGNKVENAYAYYKVYNQFKEDITKSPLAATIQVSGSDNATKVSNGKIEFKNENGYRLNLDQISVAIVDTKTGINANAILTVGEAAKVAKTEYKKLFDLTKRKFVDSITDGDKLSNYAVLFNGIDQYGNTLVDENNIKDLQVNLLSITGISTDSNKAKVITVAGDDYYAFTLRGTKNTNDATADRPGQVEVQSIAIRSGFIEKNKFEVMSATKVDTLNVRAGALGVYENQDNKLDFTALDANGKEITSWDILKKLNNTTNMPNLSGSAKLKFVKNADGKVELIYNPGSSVVGSDIDTASITQILSFISHTNKFSSANINVRKARKPVTILGLYSDTVRGTTASKRNRDFVIKAEKIKFQDQYGNLIKADEFAGGNYKISVTVENKNLGQGEGFRSVAASTSATQTIIPSSTAMVAGNGTEVVKLVAAYGATPSATGIAKVTLKLFKDGVDLKSSEEKSFEIYNARLQDMSSFAIEDPGLRPAANLDTEIHKANPVEIIDNSTKGFEPSAVGYYAGEKISLAKMDDFAVFGATNADPTFAPVPTIDPNTKSNVVNKTGVRVIVDDGKATQIDREFSYSNEARKVNKVEMGKTEFMTRTNSASWAAIKSALDVKVKDQYGAMSKIEPYITYTDFDADEVTIKDNGKKSASIALKTAGREAIVTVKFSFPGSTYTFEKTIKVK